LDIVRAGGFSLTVHQTATSLALGGIIAGYAEQSDLGFAELEGPSGL
jgi:hypothetical protein